MKNELLKDYLELTKPRILTLVLMMTVLGYYLGGRGFHSWFELSMLLIGAGMVCAGSAVLNHYLEREYDSKMMRTKNRPLPAGRILPQHALQFGIILTLIGIVILYVQINILTAFLSLLTSFLYIMVYTPLKRVSWLNTSVGAIPGAIPPLGGWAAATGTLDFNAGILFLILFIWQHPHFYAIAWMCKDDYNRAGFKMLPCLDPDGRKTFQQIKLFSWALIPVSLIPALSGLSGLLYFWGALISGCLLAFIGYRFCAAADKDNALKLLKATVMYLPILLFLIIFDLSI